MKHLNNERGYTLFLTVLIIILFSIMTFSLLTITLSGAKKSETREDVTRAGELAEKALNHLTQQINYELQTELDSHEDGLSRSHFIEVIGDVVGNYQCVNEQDSFIDTETGEYHACVAEHIDKEEDVLPQRVKLRTIGRSEDKEESLVATVAFDGNAMADYMAVNTFITDECEQSGDCVPGEGNLFLHGGVGIQGDINVDRHLFTSNRSYEKYASHHWIHSYFPTSERKPDNSKSKIIVGQNVYTVSWNSNDYSGTRMKNSIKGKINYQDHISIIDNIPNKAPYEEKEEIDEEIFKGDTIPITSARTDHPGRNQIDITKELKEKEVDYKYSHTDPGVKHIQTKIVGGTEGARRIIRNANYPNDKVFPKIDNNFHSNFIINGKSTFKKFATYQDLDLGKIRNDNDIEFKEGLYVGGDLSIRSNTDVKGEIYVEGDLTIDGNNILIDGPIFVNGEVNIKGSRNITMNTVLYVNKSVYIKHAKEDGSLLNEIKGDQMIYANGKIVIERVNRFNDHPMKLNSFYYSNESIEMDGNESNIMIYGGISAPRIVLNSIRGRSYSGVRSRQNNPQIVEARSYDGTNDQKDRNPRLRIVFGKEIFEKYKELALESRVTKVLPANTINFEKE